MSLDGAVQGVITHCQICGRSGRLERLVVFGHQPPVHAFLTPAQLGQQETAYPLNLCRCRRCGLLQLDYAVDPRVLFPPEYPYKSGVTKNLREEFRALTASLVKVFQWGQGALAVDIGSNDGTLLQGFKAHGLRVLGVEPTDVAQLAVRQGIPTLQAFFNDEVADDVVRLHGQASVVTAANVFAHVNHLPAFLRGVRKLLPRGGAFVTESHYALDLLQHAEFDTIYHEHLRFYALRPLMRLLEANGLTVVDARRIPTHGGSIRVVAVKGGAWRRSPRLRALLRHERAAGLYERATVEAFGARVAAIKRELLQLLLRCHRRGRIMGIGAPARASALLSYCRIDTDLVECTLEQSASLKVGLYTPGSHLPVLDEGRLLRDQPPYALLLSWHIGDELMPKLRARGFRGRFILPLPRPRLA